MDVGYHLPVAMKGPFVHLRNAAQAAYSIFSSLLVSIFGDPNALIRPCSLRCLVLQLRRSVRGRRSEQLAWEGERQKRHDVLHTCRPPT